MMHANITRNYAGSYSRSRYELENKCVIHFGCVVVVWSLVELCVEFDCCVNCSRVAWLVAVQYGAVGQPGAAAGKQRS